MIQGVSSYDISASSGYIALQADDISPAKFEVKNKSMLLLGCGDGEVLNNFGNLYPEWRFTGVDFNASYVSKGKAGAPKNVDYIECKFSTFKSEERFGVVCSPGLLSWIEDEERRAVLEIVNRNLSIAGIASFGFDNSLFWLELAPIREFFLSAWIEYGDWRLALEVTRPVAKTYNLSCDFKRLILNRMMTEAQLPHWLLQPHWHPMMPSQVIMDMSRIGCHIQESVHEVTSRQLLSPLPYMHMDFLRS